MLIQPKIEKRRVAWAKPVHIGQYFTRGIGSRITSKPSYSAEAVRAYFGNRMHDHAIDPKIMDGHETKYISQIKDLTGVDHTSCDQVVDLGCGDGAAYQYLKAQECLPDVYVGVDFAVQHRSLGERANIFHADAAEFLPANDKETSILCINSICYFNELNKIPAFRAPGTNELVVIEPFPSTFWYRHFNGVVPSYRSPGSLADELQALGWTLEHQVTYYLLEFGSKYLGPLCYAQRFIRSPDRMEPIVSQLT